MIREYIIKVDEDKADIMGNCPLVEKPQELIRCKDCINFCSAEQNDAGEDLCSHLLMKAKPYGFCADGERK